jgi:hypothetical protein
MSLSFGKRLLIEVDRTLKYFFAALPVIAGKLRAKRSRKTRNPLNNVKHHSCKYLNNSD